MKKPAQGVSIHIETPELDKMTRVQKESQSIGAFLDWLQNEKNMLIGQYDGEYDFSVEHKRIEEWLAEYFEIDLDKVEQERRAILAGLQASHLGVLHEIQNRR